MRVHSIHKIRFMGISFLMNAIKDDWGIDDVVVSEITNGAYNEGEALSWWMAMLRTSEPGDLFIDTGSYTGLYSLVAASLGGEKRTVAIEASVITYSRLVQNILVNRFDVSILPTHIAISDKMEIVRLGHAFGVLTMASGESLAPSYELDHTELVPATTFDDLIFQKPGSEYGAVTSKAMGVLPASKVGGVKIDVEGVEYSALSGGTRFLEVYTPSLLIEILDNDNLQKCRSLLASYGYEQIAQCAGLNYVFAHSSKKDALIATHEKLRRDHDLTFHIAHTLSFSV